MGVVYLARDLRLDRPVAIKTLPPHLAGDPIIRERFVREARTAAALSHPNIVPIHRADELSGQVFFVMGYIQGESVAQRLRRGPMPPHEAVRMLRDVALALAYAHARGVVHRDIKAENILLDDRDGRAMVTDFGIARLAEAAPLTATGQVLGTVYYLSPEQVSGERVDGRSDLYSLGIVGFLALSGRFPFDAELASAVLVAHVTRLPPPLASVAADVPPSLAQIIERCMAKEPASRYQTGTELADALGAVARELERDQQRLAVSRPPAAPAHSALVSDTEAQDVWRRAAELQASTPSHQVTAPQPVYRDTERDQARTSGYRLPDVRDAAREAGIATQFVDRALAEHGFPVGIAAARSRAGAPAIIERTSAPLGWLSGGPADIAYEVVLDGELDSRDFDLFADTIRRSMHEIGNLSAVGRSMTWHSLDMKSRRVQISMLVRSGQTTIRASENLRPIIGGLFGGIVGGGGGGFGGMSMGIVAGTTHAVLAGFGTWVLSIAAAYGVARTIFRHVAIKRRARLRELVEELSEQARQSIAGSARQALPR